MKAISRWLIAIKRSELDPKNATAYDNRGNAYLAKGDYDHAMADYNEAIRSIQRMHGAKAITDPVHNRRS